MTEVSTLITDYLLGGLLTLLGIYLLLDWRKCLPVFLWGWAFIALAMAAFVGGTWHGFRLMLPESLAFWMWKAVVYFIGAFGLFSVSGSISAAFSGRDRGLLLGSFVAITIIYALWMMTHTDFVYVVCFNAAAMAFVLGIHAYTGIRRRDPSSLWIIAGIAASGVAAVVQVAHVSFHKHFDNNDLFHVVQMAGMYLLFRGVKRLGDAEEMRGAKANYS